MYGKHSFAFLLGLSSVKKQTRFHVHRKLQNRPLCSSIPYSLDESQVHYSDASNSKVHSTTQRISNSKNLLGPPDVLASLNIGVATTLDNSFGGAIAVERLSRDPDIFLARNALNSEEIRSFIKSCAEQQGLKVAGTKKSSENSIRKNSYLTWLDRNDDDSSINTRELLKNMEHFAGNNFIHESLLRSKNSMYEFESLQVAKYEEGGKFDLHHDDYGRFITVLYYLNGVGGTYFPYARTKNCKRTTLENNSNEEIPIPGKDGLLIVGSEDAKKYLPHPFSTEDIDPFSIAYIKPGDAVIFYNYRPGGEKDDNSMHKSLSVQTEKWIATNWIRSEKLTSPFGYMYADQIISEDMGLVEN